MVCHTASSLLVPALTNIAYISLIFESKLHDQESHRCQDFIEELLVHSPLQLSGLTDHPFWPVLWRQSLTADPQKSAVTPAPAEAQNHPAEPFALRFLTNYVLLGIPEMYADRRQLAVVRTSFFKGTMGLMVRTLPEVYWWTANPCFSSFRRRFFLVPLASSLLNP